jgi:glycosyltransferase involved in cell wall biosynthesis
MLLAPSLAEGFGLPVAESLLAGCPVVCSELAVFREIGGAHCRYVALGTSFEEEFANAVASQWIAPRPEPVPLPQFSLRTISQRYASLYQSLLSTCMPYATPVAKRPHAEPEWRSQ